MKDIKIIDRLINTTGKTIPPGTYTVGVCKVEQVCGRIERTIDIGKAVEGPEFDMMLGRCKVGDDESGEAFLANSARQLGVEYAFGKPGDDPRDLEFKPFGIGKLEIISWDEAVPCGDDAVSQGMLTRWLPLHDPAAPSKAFPHGFADTIYFPMRKGIRKIVIRRKPK